jgi:hypothetical protein
LSASSDRACSDRAWSAKRLILTMSVAEGTTLAGLDAVTRP